MKFKFGKSQIALNKVPDKIAIAYEGQKGDLNHFTIIDTPANEMETALDTERSATIVEKGSHVYTLKEDPKSIIVPTGDIYIETTNEVSLTDLATQFNLVLKTAKGTNAGVYTISDASPNPLKVCVALQELDGITVAEPELLTAVTSCVLGLPGDPLLENQWHLKNTGNGTEAIPAPRLFKTGADAKVIKAWEFLRNYGSHAVKVAIVDDGFDLGHPDFAGKIVGMFNANSGDNYVHFEIGQWHGTAVAGVTLAAANGQGTVGAAPNSRFVPIRLNFITDAIIERWCAYIKEQQIDIVNCSWTSRLPMSTRIFNAIKDAATNGRNGKGTIFVFAAGNDNRPVFEGELASHPNVICVGASNSLDQSAYYTNYGKYITCVAPSNDRYGVSITTTDVRGRGVRNGQIFEMGYSPGAYTDRFGGTSSAAPLVAGIIGLLLSRNPNLTAQQVKAIVKKSCDKIGHTCTYNLNGYSDLYGYGRINALKCVKNAFALNATTTEVDQEVLSTANKTFEDIEL